MEDDSNVANDQLVLLASHQKGSLWNIYIIKYFNFFHS
jgi:hypothetical protein